MGLVSDTHVHLIFPLFGRGDVVFGLQGIPNGSRARPVFSEGYFTKVNCGLSCNRSKEIKWCRFPYDDQFRHGDCSGDPCSTPHWDQQARINECLKFQKKYKHKHKPICLVFFNAWKVHFKGVWSVGLYCLDLCWVRPGFDAREQVPNCWASLPLLPGELQQLPEKHINILFWKKRSPPKMCLLYKITDFSPPNYIHRKVCHSGHYALGNFDSKFDQKCTVMSIWFLLYNH